MINKVCATWKEQRNLFITSLAVSRGQLKILLSEIYIINSEGPGSGLRARRERYPNAGALVLDGWVISSDSRPRLNRKERSPNKVHLFNALKEPPVLLLLHRPFIPTDSEQTCLSRSTSASSLVSGPIGPLVPPRTACSIGFSLLASQTVLMNDISFH